MKKICFIAIIVFHLTSSLVSAETVKMAHAEVELIADPLNISPGDSFLLSIRFKLDDHWHIYGKDPGDAGMPTRVEWILPDGFTAGELEWPETKTIKESDEVTVNAYEGEVLLTSRILTSNKSVSKGEKLISANVEWLACNEICVPGEAELSTYINVGSGHVRTR